MVLTSGGLLVAKITRLDGVLYGLVSYLADDGSSRYWGHLGALPQADRRFGAAVLRVGHSAWLHRGDVLTGPPLSVYQHDRVRYRMQARAVPRPDQRGRSSHPF